MFCFDAELIKGTQFNGWTYVDLPYEVALKLNKKGRIPVCGHIDSCEFRSSLNKKGDGSLFLFVSQPLQKAMGKQAGDVVKVQLAVDTEPRIALVPNDLAEALAESEKARQVFQRFTYSHQKEVIDWIDDAKKAETRIRRIVKAIGIFEKYK
ncbi:MAG: YdeI/OmpD-associated family protein [Bacteroidota bacterium]